MKKMSVKKLIFSLLAILLIGFSVFIYYALHVTKPMTVTHTFDAPVEKVWKIWSDANSIQQWWGPDGYEAPVVKNDLRVGGSFLLSMQGPDEKIIYNSGQYKEVIENKKIVSVMSFSLEDGTAVPASQYDLPGAWPNEVEVTVNFDSQGDKTLVTVHEEGVPMILYVFSQMGWNQQFGKFEQLLAK